MHATVIMYTSPTCPFCIRAKALLDQKGVDYQEICVLKNADKRDEMIQRTGRQTVPQIIINEKAIGGCDDLYALETSGDLDNLLREK